VPCTTRPHGSFNVLSKIASVLNSERHTMNLDLYGILSTARIQSFTNANEREGMLNPNFNIKLTIPSDCFPNPKIIFAVVF
jgi:hypothetical protein